MPPFPEMIPVETTPCSATHNDTSKALSDTTDPDPCGDIEPAFCFQHRPAPADFRQQSFVFFSGISLPTRIGGESRKKGIISLHIRGKLDSAPPQMVF